MLKVASIQTTKAISGISRSSGLSTINVEGVGALAVSAVSLSPLAYWPLNEASGTSALDISGNSRNMSGSSAPTRVSGALLPGASSGSTIAGEHLTGSAQETYTGSTYLAVADAAWNDLTGAFSICAVVDWWNPNNAYAWVGLQKSQDYNGWGLIRRSSGPANLRLATWSGGVASALDYGIPAAGKYFVVGTYNGTTAKLYVNGSQVASGAITAPAGGISAPTVVDSQFATSDVGLWNRELSADEVGTLWSSAGSGFDHIQAGDTITVSGLSNSTFNGKYSVASTSGNSISYYNAGSDVSQTAATGTVDVLSWSPRSPLVSDSYTRSFGAITANYISPPSRGPQSQSLAQSANAGQLDLSWATPGSSYYGTPSDGETYDTAYTYRAYNATAGFYSAAQSGTSYSFTGLANGSGYWCESQARNNYRSSSWVGGGGLLQYTRTVRQYGTISVNSSGAQSYNGSNVNRVGGDSDYMYHGYVSPTHGLQKTGFYYDFSSVPAGAVVTGATLALSSLHWYNASGGVIDVRIWGNTWTGSGTDGGVSIAQVGWGSRTGSIQFNIDAALVQAYIRNNTRLVLGLHAPGNSTSLSHYGYFYGPPGQYGCPLNISYYWDS